MRYHGKVGYAICEETSPSVWVDHIVEREYTGDMYKLSAKWQTNDHLNDNLSIGNQISILADPFAYNYFSQIKYAEIMGSLWKVVGIEVERPRLILTLGGVYNGEQAET